MICDHALRKVLNVCIGRLIWSEIAKFNPLQAPLSRTPEQPLSRLCVGKSYPEA